MLMATALGYLILLSSQLSNVIDDFLRSNLHKEYRDGKQKRNEKVMALSCIIKNTLQT